MSQYSQPQQPPYAAPNLPGGIPDTQTSTMAIFSLVLGIASFLCSLLAGIPAIILGIIALSKIGKSNGRLQGGGLATAGIVTGAIGCLLSVVMLGVLLPAVQAVRTAARRTVTMNNIRMINLGCLNYESAHGQMPSNIDPRNSETGEQLSWRVHLLPFIDQQHLYDQFHLDEPWDSPHNKSLIPFMPMCYEHPQFQLDLPVGHTVFQMPTSGPNDEVRAIHVAGEEGIRFGALADGSSNTILIVETDAQSAVPWTKPTDWRFDANNPNRNLGGAFPGGTTVGACDGSTHFLATESMSDENLNALLCPNDGAVGFGFQSHY